MAILATFEEEELSRLYSAAATGGPVFETGIVGNGKAVQQRTVNRYDAVRTYEIGFGGRTPEFIQGLEEFFITKYGRAIGFRFFPPSDNTFQNDVIGVVAAGNTVYYCKRNYRSRTRFVSRRIVKPVKDTLVVTVGGQMVPIYNDAGVAVYPAGSETHLNKPVTIDWDTGTITFDTAPGAGSVVRIARGEYDLPVYFDVDAFAGEEYGIFSNWQSIRLTEILPSAITTAGIVTNSLRLAFTSPHSNQTENDLFNVTLSHTNVDNVYLFTDDEPYGNAVLDAADLTSPFSFSNVAPPSVAGEFELIALGVNNTTGEVVEAMITLNTAGYAPDTTPPTPPTSLAQVSATGSSVTVSFTPGTD